MSTWRDAPDYSTPATITVATSTTISAAVDCKNKTLCGVLLPTAFTGVAMTFQMSDTIDGTYVAVQDGAGSSYSVTVAQGKYVPVDPNKFLGIRFLRVVSGSAEGADRIVQLSLRLR